MNDKKDIVKFKYKSKRGKDLVGENRIKVRGKDIKGNSTPRPLPPYSYEYEFDLSMEPGKDEYISLGPRKDGETPACTIVIPSTLHYRFNPAGKEKIDMEHDQGSTTINIPPGAPRWILKLGKSGADINKGTSDPVIIVDDEEGGPPDKDLVSLLNRVMNNTVPLDDFLARTGKEMLGSRQRTLLIQQALVLVENAYVHLPLKKAMYAVDPVQRLKLLMHRNPQLDDRAFHDRMISIFTELRDLHTIYTLPAAYKDKVAFLPFLIEEYHDENDERKYMVSKIIDADSWQEEKEKEDPSFAKGVTITHWNGVPIEHAVKLNGEKNAGNNESARHARGLQRMTIRPLEMTIPPDEHWVDIDYLENETKQPANRRFKWYAAEIPRREGAMESKKEAMQTALGVDFETEMTLRVKKSLFESGREQEMNTEASWGKLYCQWDETIGDEYYEFRIIEVKAGEKFSYAKKFGYFRIYSFNVNDPDYFVNIFIDKIKNKLEEKWIIPLIIDVRGNGGGLITAGERLLEVLTQNKIEPERFQFINSPLMQQLCQKTENDKNGLKLKKWEKSIQQSIETGATYSQAFPIEPDSTEIREIKQNDKYNGKVVLVTDALCYSTTDIFAAGFQDNQIGKILGVHKHTGAGGANVWRHKVLGDLLPGESSIAPLPEGCEFTVALRRSTRVGENVGLPLEDLGVEPDEVHKMTRNDLLYRNRDLIIHAACMLDEELCKEKEKEITK